MRVTGEKGKDKEKIGRIINPDSPIELSIIQENEDNKS